MQNGSRGHLAYNVVLSAFWLTMEFQGELDIVVHRVRPIAHAKEAAGVNINISGVVSCHGILHVVS